MGETTVSIVEQDLFYICPEANLNMRYLMASGSAAQLESGYKDVYKTGVRGIGVRFKVATPFASWIVVPHETSGANNLDWVVARFIQYQFVQTSQTLGTGNLKLNFNIRFTVNGWEAADMSGNAEVAINYQFSSCAGVSRNISVPLGKVRASDVQADATSDKALDLNVHCAGLPPGSQNFPVKAYFEGNFRTPGRLRLPSGGAGGVEISVLNEQGMTLPTSKATAMSMKWMRSDARGELYNLPIKARYVKIPGSLVTPGKANATLNYILEYN